MWLLIISSPPQKKQKKKTVATTATTTKQTKTADMEGFLQMSSWRIWKLLQNLLTLNPDGGLLKFLLKLDIITICK